MEFCSSIPFKERQKLELEILTSFSFCSFFNFCKKEFVKKFFSFSSSKERPFFKRIFKINHSKTKFVGSLVVFVGFLMYSFKLQL